MKNITNEFKNYATKHRNLNTLTVEAVMKNQNKGISPTNLTPHVVEERHMNIAIMSVFDRLMMDRIIWLGTGINDEIANVVQAQLLFLQSIDSKKDITVYCNSPGGSVLSGLGIISTMNLISPDVATINTGMCASMAAVILAAGCKGKRSALKYARTMIHQIMGGNEPGSQLSDIKITTKFMEDLETDLYTILSEGSYLSYEEVKIKSERDYWMRPEEALKLGFIDEILNK